MKKLIYSITIMVFVTFLAGIVGGCYSGSPTTSNNRYSVPDWAPAYEPGVRYYYIPDIETYYDVANGNFVYLDRGMWIFSRDLPPLYRGYDLHSGYQVIIDRKVYEPWRYHQNYITSYPRYYYRDIYSNREDERIRGYNENAERPIYMSTPNNSRRSGSYRSGRGTGTSGESQSGDYGNRRSGTMERGNSEMRQPEQQTPSGTSSRRQSQSSGSGIGSGNENSGEIMEQRKSTTTAPPSVEKNGSTRESGSNDYNQRRSGSMERKSPEMRQPGQHTPSGTSSRRQSQSTGSGTGSGNESSGEVMEQRKSTTTAPPAVNNDDNRQQNSGDSNNRERKSSRRR